ncbi:MAG: protein kinase [Myxococcales bacterium]|nr:protein kinase [Myxococcales bacterium]
MPKPVILCVDDERSVLVGLKEQLKRGFGGHCLVETADDGEAALELYAELTEDGYTVPLVISDQIMPGLKGDALLAELHRRDPSMLKVMLTGQAGAEAVGNAVNAAGLYRFIAKPWHQDDLTLTVREALRRYEDARTLAAQHATLVEMHEAALDLAGNLAAEDRYQRMVRRMARALPADRVALLRVEGDRLRVLATCGKAQLPPTLEVRRELEADLGATAPVRRVEDPLWPDARATVRVALRVQDEVVGLLALGSAEVGAHDDVRDERILGFASLAAASMHTAELFDALEEALEHRRRVSQELIRQANDRISGPLIGSSLAIRRLRDAISAHAAGDGALLVLGPHGSGCEATARAIHNESARADRAFLMVNCAVVQRVDEIFGAGGANREALAAGGTLYLAGVNRLPAAVQLEVAERIVAGSSARVLASAYEDAGGRSGPAVLQRELEAAFGERLRVPPLRQRRDDLPELADFFLRMHATRAGRVIDPLDDKALARLAAYDWPGNVQELSHVIQRAVLTARGRQVEIGEALLEATTELGGYRLVERIASGGMGEVWRAEHRHIVRPAAVKLIRPAGEGADGQGALARFKREAAATARLCSPHTVELYDYGVSDNGAFFYVMELLRGMDLQSLVAFNGALPPARVVHLLTQACRSLKEAHAVGMVHRDIKPANLIACRLGAEYDFVKVLDFGMVTALPGEDTALTQPGGLAGTPGYLAPECIQPDGVIDGRADIYSLGCVAWWLLTGQQVFVERSAVATLFAHIQRPVPALRPLASDVPEDLEALVRACLAKDPIDRPQTPGMLIDRLRAVHLTDTWTDSQAEAWWRGHLPALCVDDALPLTPDPTAPTMA